MRAFIAILLASVFMFQSASKLLILTNYAMNKEYITKTFCENKDKPKMHCNGKCHMRKQLQKEDKKEDSTSNNLREKFEIQFFSGKVQLQFSELIPQKNKLNIRYLLNEHTQYRSGVFHPPCI